MLPRTQFGIRPPTPAGKGTINTPRRPAETLARIHANAAALAAQEIVATGACARTQTLADARAMVQGYLASLGPAIVAILNGGRDDSRLPGNAWIAQLGPVAVGSIQRPDSIRAVADLLPQALLTACQTMASARPGPTEARPTYPVARPVGSEMVQGAPVARPGPQEYVSTSVPVARQVPVDSTPRRPTLRSRDLPSIPVTSDRQGYTQENTDARPAMGARGPSRDAVLRAAAADAIGLSGVSACSNIAFVSPARDRLVRSVVERFQSSWTPQMVAVLGGAAIPAGLDGPRWYREMIAQVGGQPAARQMMAYVLEQMPGAIVSLCADIRRQAERE